jgi:hypothetical protein
MNQFQSCIEQAFNTSRGNQLDENILFVSFSSLPVKDSPIPYTIRLTYKGTFVVYQTASIYYQNTMSQCMATILAKSSNAEWFSFRWEGGNDGKAISLSTMNNLPRVRISKGTFDYNLEGIMFYRSWDQMSSFTSPYSDSLEAATVSRISKSKNAGVTSEDIKTIRTQTGWVIDKIISNVLLRMYQFYKRPSCILVEEVSQALLDGILLHACGKTKDTRDEMDQFVVSNSFDDLEVWKKTYDRIDEHMNIFSRNLESFFDPSVPKFLIYPISVHNNTHWILLVVSTGQKCIFIIDSFAPNGNQKDVFIVAILIKYLEYKSSISNGAFVFQSSDWRIKSLPATQQQDGYNCGIHLIMNAAMIMRQIAQNDTVELSFVENPMPVYEKKSIVLRERVNIVRTRLYNMFLFRDTFDSVMDCIFTADSNSISNNPKTPPKAPPKGKPSKKGSSKVVFLDK